MVGDFCESGLYVIVRGTILGFFGEETFRVMVAVFLSAGRKTVSSTNAAVRKFGFVNVRTMLRNGEALVSLPVSRPICPVSPNSMASMTPLLPDPFGPEITKVSFRKSITSFRMPLTSSI